MLPCILHSPSLCQSRRRPLRALVTPAPRGMLSELLHQRDAWVRRAARVPFLLLPFVSIDAICLSEEHVHIPAHSPHVAITALRCAARLRREPAV